MSRSRGPVIDRSILGDTEKDRTQYVLGEQFLCDTFLSHVASPRDQSVIVLGAGAGTDALWALRHGAREVVAIDLAEQDPRALHSAMESLGLEMGNVPEFLQMSIEEAPSLDRRFDLVISHNVFEHVTDLKAAFAACAELVTPVTGRVGIFSSPLYYSSMGHHMLLEPWEHLWGDAASIMESLRATLPEKRAALDRMTLSKVLSDEFGLNQALFGDFLAAIAQTRMTCLTLGALPDRNMDRFAEFQPRLESLGVSPFDLTTEGIFLELALPERSESRVSYQSNYQSQRGQEMSPGDLAQLLLRLERECAELERARAELEEILRRTQRSPSLRIGRMLTAPFRLARRWARLGGR